MAMSISDFYQPFAWPVVRMPERKTFGDTLTQFIEWNDKREDRKRQAEIDKENAEIRKMQREDILAKREEDKADRAAKKGAMDSAKSRISDYYTLTTDDEKMADMPAWQEGDDMGILADELGKAGVFDAAREARQTQQYILQNQPKKKTGVKVTSSGEVIQTIESPDGTVETKVVREGTPKPVSPTKNYINTGQAVLKIMPDGTEKVVWTAPKGGGSGGGGGGSDSKEAVKARVNLAKQNRRIEAATSASNKIRAQIGALKSLKPEEVLVGTPMAEMAGTMPPEQAHAMAKAYWEDLLTKAEAERQSAQQDYEASAEEYQAAFPDQSGQFYLPRRVNGQPAQQGGGILDSIVPALGRVFGGAQVPGTPGINPAEPAPTNPKKPLGMDFLKGL